MTTGRSTKRDTEMYGRLFNLLTFYISEITARSILDRALARCGVSTDHLLAETLLSVVEQARVGIGMFCKPERLTSLMLDLAVFCDESTIELGREDAEPPALPGIKSTRPSGSYVIEDHRAASRSPAVASEHRQAADMRAGRSL